MFEITKQELRGLNGAQLRELVARLCEAELRVHEMPASSVRWSGAHTAPDGGLDVECRVEDSGFRGDFVPLPRTGFQVKKPLMPPVVSRIPSWEHRGNWSEYSVDGFPGMTE